MKCGGGGGPILYAVQVRQVHTTRQVNVTVRAVVVCCVHTDGRTEERTDGQPTTRTCASFVRWYEMVDAMGKGARASQRKGRQLLKMMMDVSTNNNYPKTSPPPHRPISIFSVLWLCACPSIQIWKMEREKSPVSMCVRPRAQFALATIVGREKEREKTAAGDKAALCDKWAACCFSYASNSNDWIK